MIGFKADQHQYFSLDGSSTLWTGVTTLVGRLKEKFDAGKQAPKSHRNRNSKWYQVPVEDILQAWENEGKRAADLGHWYHDYREQAILNRGVVNGLPVIRSQVDNNIKIAPDQRLSEGIYPEHMVYLQSAGICGQSDIVRVQDGKVHISDFKTSKEITTEGYSNWEGVKKKMLPPVQHLQDCHLTHYSLQLSLYMYIILRHNPHLQPGNMHIDHVRFVEAGKDKYGYPIYYNDEEGNPIVQEIIQIPVPYLNSEVQTIIKWLRKQ